MDSSDILIASFMCLALTVGLFFYGWRSVKNPVIMKLAILPLLLSVMLNMINLGYGDPFYTKNAFYMIIAIIFIFGFSLYKIGQDILRKELNHDQ